ncbi:MAG: chlorite dismutase family protein [Elusimicrobia bacterium]|nr:chlorite dismutase family protein [Elusimicrobiota bacterium]
MEVKTSAEEKTEAKQPLVRQYVRFVCYKLDLAFRKLDPNVRHQAKEEVFSALDLFRDRMMLFTYNLTATRADADFMFWQIAEDLEVFEEFSSRLTRSGLGLYMTRTHSFLSMTKHSLYVDKINPEHPQGRSRIQPGQHRFLFVYPFVKTKAWYQLPMAERQKMMDEHIVIGNKYPSVKLNTTYSFGLDDQEFVVAFESDSPQDFLDLVQELRGSKASQYTLRDTPTITAIARDPKWILDALG